MSRIVERHLTTLGFTIEEQLVGPQRPNVIAFHSCGIYGAPTLGLNAHMDTVGTERTYKRPDGHTVTVSGGTYGWITDSAATTPLIVDALENHKSDPIAVPCKQEAASFDGIGKADWGDTWIEVDLAAQYAWYYVDGECVWETAIVSGTPDGEHAFRTRPRPHRGARPGSRAYRRWRRA